MSQSSVPASVSSTTKSRPGVSHALYREIIYRSGIILDPTGREITEEGEIQELLNTYILKSPNSQPLSVEEVIETVDVAADLMHHAEASALALLNTKAFSMKRHGIAEGNGTQWNTIPLPSNPVYPHRLSAPKPDCHYGYAPGRKFNWTDEEMAIIDDLGAQPYIMPTRETVFPFLTIEFKSEATGGVLYVAENQGVGSGVHIVASQRWLQNQAFPGKVLAATDAVAFVAAVSPRTAVFYVTWFSEKKGRYIMSKIRIISFMEGQDIQRCRDLTDNIMGYALGKRLEHIRETLAKLNPVH